jgi:hypothetical protein
VKLGIDVMSLKQFIILVLLLNTYSFSGAQTSITLHDSLTAAIEKQSNSISKKTQRLASSADKLAWLDGSPSASLMYLDSQDSLGTTETEVSLNLPIKSPFLREVEKSLSSNIEALRVNAQKQYALYLSGLIRSILWGIRAEEVSAVAVTKKQEILLALSEQYSDMAAVQAIPRYLSLIVQKEYNDQKILLIQHHQNINSLKAKYQRLTGLRDLPHDITETVPELNLLNVNAHPDVLALDAAYQNTEQSLLSGSKKATAWNVQVTGKRVETANYSDNQLGLGIEVPLTIGNKLSNIQQSQYINATTEYNIARSKLINQLADAQATLLQEYEFLKQKQDLLDSGKSNVYALAAAMQELRGANAPNQEFYLRTLLDTVDSEKDIELNLIQVNRQIALMRQAAGLTL